MSIDIRSTVRNKIDRALNNKVIKFEIYFPKDWE